MNQIKYLFVTFFLVGLFLLGGDSSRGDSSRSATSGDALGMTNRALGMMVEGDVPKDQPSATLIRHSGEQTLEVHLTKNLFRTEYREMWHEHAHTGDHHAGHDPSTWYEQYEALEPYYETEYYWDWESYYDYEPYYEWVCHGPQNCRWVVRTRPVLKRRWVQKSRQVLRYRNVIKTRLRTFTDSHMHEVPVQVYDRTVERDVALHFPEGATLNASETEKIEFSFDGEEVTVRPLSPYYLYLEIDRSYRPNAVIITLGLDGLNNASFGLQSLGEFTLYKEGGYIFLKIVDTMAGHEGVETDYQIKMERSKWLIGTKVVCRANWKSDGTQEMIYLLEEGADNPVARGLREAMEDGTEYTVRLRVHRANPLFAGGQVFFEKEKELTP